MTRNFATRDYRRDKMTPKQRYWHLVGCGINEEKAAEMAKYSERDEIVNSLKLWLVFAALIGLIVLVLAYAPPVLAAYDDPEHSQRNEAWFAACLNGVTINVGGQHFQCLPVGGGK